MNPGERVLRRAVADYMRSEGCSCCRNQEAHDEARKRLANLLDVPKRQGWYSFKQYETPKEKNDANK